MCVPYREPGPGQMGQPLTSACGMPESRVEGGQKTVWRAMGAPHSGMMSAAPLNSILSARFELNYFFLQDMNSFVLSARYELIYFVIKISTHLFCLQDMNSSSSYVIH